MDIGGKLKAARLAAGMTQEQIAEALGVSRQTVSNWENGRTYPDIVSVVKLSDIYEISLDTLLKEEKTMTKYTEYLAESTDVVRSKNRMTKVLEVGIYLIVWAAALIAFCICCIDTRTPNDVNYGIGYASDYIIRSDGYVFEVMIPLCLLVLLAVLSYMIGRDRSWGWGKWFMPLYFGILFAIALLLPELLMRLLDNYYAEDVSSLIGQIILDGFSPLAGSTLLSFGCMAVGHVLMKLMKKKAAQSA